MTITLNDRREIDATVVGSDERTDVALLKVNGSGFPELRTGDVDKLRVGEPVLAIGSPLVLTTPLLPGLSVPRCVI